VVVAGSPEARPVVVPLRAYGRVAGELLYGDPMSPLRRADRAVLADLAAQLAILMHARALTVDLRTARERLVLAREEERRRLRRDLHDGLGAALAGLMLKVENARALMRDDPDAAERDLAAVRQDIASTVGDVRTLVEGLRPPAIDELGLPAALTQAVRRLATHRSAQVSIDCPESLGDVPAAVEVAIYRIVGEAVTNAIKHADAAACRVTIARRAGFLTAEVADTGPGLAGPTDADRDSVGGNGLATMRERAEELGGTLTLSSGPTGVSVRASLPVPGDGSKPEPGGTQRRVPETAPDPVPLGGGL
jgi:signal transduction histidine kinase